MTVTQEGAAEGLGFRLIATIAAHYVRNPDVCSKFHVLAAVTVAVSHVMHKRNPVGAVIDKPGISFCARTGKSWIRVADNGTASTAGTNRLIANVGVVVWYFAQYVASIVSDYLISDEIMIVQDAFCTCGSRRAVRLVTAAASWSLDDVVARAAPFKVAGGTAATTATAGTAGTDIAGSTAEAATAAATAAGCTIVIRGVVVEHAFACTATFAA